MNVAHLLSTSTSRNTSPHASPLDSPGSSRSTAFPSHTLPPLTLGLSLGDPVLLARVLPARSGAMTSDDPVCSAEPTHMLSPLDTIAAAAAALPAAPVPYDLQPHRCSVAGCDSKFGQRGSLTRHLKNKHTANPRTHACPHCPSRFSERWTLNVHVRNVHLKIKAHKCPYTECAARPGFSELWNLRKHISIVHLLNRPFPCPHCKRFFGYKGDMKKHVDELHTSSSEARPYICQVPGCAVKFARMRYLRRHQNLNHTANDDVYCEPHLAVLRAGSNATASGSGGGLSPVTPMPTHPASSASQMTQMSLLSPSVFQAQAHSQHQMRGSSAMETRAHLRSPPRTSGNLELFADIASTTAPSPEHV
jgi:hypothetical protein